MIDFLKRAKRILSKTIGRQKLDTLIFFVTGKCNSRCQNCFYWQRLNQTQDFSLNRIKEIVKTMPKFNNLLISGGEPFLRNDLPDIISLFKKYSYVQSVSIPTNALLPDEIFKIIKEILEKNTDLDRIYLNISLDGNEIQHDKIRGVPGNFQKVILLINKLQELRVKYNNFFVQINTVIYRQNYNDILSLANFLLKNVEVDGHFFEISRGDLQDNQEKKIPAKDLKDLYNKIMLIHKKYLSKQQLRLDVKGIKKIRFTQSYLGNLIYTYQNQYLNYTKNKKWPCPCQAGQSIIVMEHDGNLKACELRKEIGNIKDFNFNFGKFLSSFKLKKEIAQIRKNKCFCTHVCFLMTSALHSWKSFFGIIPFAYLKYKLLKKIL